jgi:hypothetical protein
MNRRIFHLLSAACCVAVLAALTGATRAWKLTTSKLIVKVMSVDRESSSRREYSGGVSVETTKFVAKAQIQEVLVNEHGLSPGAIVEIRYAVDVRQPPLPNARDRGRLNPGETTTVTVAGGGTRYEWIR